MDEVDRKLLNIIQDDFPLVATPYEEIAQKLGTSSHDVIERVRKLKEDGVIRRIGAIFEGRKLGFASTLCAAVVPEKKIGEFVKAVNSRKGVTHNYRRLTIQCLVYTKMPGQEELAEELEKIKKDTGIANIITMRAIRVFKINAVFDI